MSTPQLTTYNVADSLTPRVRILRKLLWHPQTGLRNPKMLYIARQVTRACVARDVVCELRAIFEFVVRNVRYTGDMAGVDTFSAPLRTLQMGGEDCDGHTLVNAALAIANGFKAKARITSNRGTSWDHIYCMVGLPKGRDDRWLALDTTLARTQSDFSRFGVEPRFVKFKDFDLTEVTD